MKKAHYKKSIIALLVVLMYLLIAVAFAKILPLAVLQDLTNSNIKRRILHDAIQAAAVIPFAASVAEELLLNTRLTEESKSHARNLLKELGLYEYRDAHPSALSGGQKQRLAIACAVFSGRRILILDEPTSGLDGKNMRLIAEKLKSEARNGRTILVITHDRELIESCCDNIVEVKKRSS